jgi:chaperonin GroES
MAKKAKTDIQPLDDRVVVRPLEAEERTAGGIVLPDSAKEKPQQGEIIAAGPGRLLDNGDRGGLSVKVGDRVFYGKYAGTEVKVEGEELKIMRESDILGILQ